MRALPIYVTSLLFALFACATAPKSQAKRDALVTRAEATLQEMRAKDPALGPIVDNAAGYAVFPSIGKGGVIVGAAYGRGVLFENGRFVGFVELNQGSLGAQLGAQTFAELIVMQTQDALQAMKAGNFSVGVDASAIALTTGAAATATFEGGYAVFVMPRGGVMAELTISGQQINYKPRGG